MTQVDVSEAYWRRMIGVHHPAPCLDVVEYVYNDEPPEDVVIVPSPSDYLTEEPNTRQQPAAYTTFDFMVSAMVSVTWRMIAVLV